MRTRATRLPKTLAAAQENLASVDAAPTAEDPAECVTDLSLTTVLKALDNGPWKSAKGFARWRGDEAARRAVTNNRTRLVQAARRDEAGHNIGAGTPQIWRYFRAAQMAFYLGNVG